MTDPDRTEREPGRPAEPPPGRAGGRLASRLFLAVLLVAALVRLGHLQRGLPYLHYWDEPHTAAPSIRMMKTGDLNPGRFRYGSLPSYLFLASDVAHWVWANRRPDPITGERPQLEDIQTQYETGWLWSISHPGYYAWNRAVVALAGCGTIALLWLLAGWRARRAALLGAVLLAGLRSHVHYSVMIAPDMIAACLCVSVVALVLRFHDTQRFGFLLAAFVAWGAATATKYNAAIVGIVPVVAFAIARRRGLQRTPGWYALGPLIAVLTFCACMPYAILDLPTFLKDVGIEVYHYSHAGHFDKSAEPGLSHVLLQLDGFAQRLTLFVFPLCVLGLLSLVRTTRGRLLLLFPVVAFVLQAQTTVRFHRNLMPVYPFLALGFGLVIERLLVEARARGLGRLAAGLVVSGALAFLAVVGVDAWRTGTVVETRTRAAELVARLAREHGWRKIGFDENLHMHPQDLARIGAVVVEDDLRRLVARGTEFDALVAGAEFAARESEEEFANLEIEARTASELNAARAGREVVAEIPGGPTYLQKPSRDPGLVVLGPAPAAAAPGGD